MVVYQQKVRESSSCSVHAAGCLSWSSVGSNAPEGMNRAARTTTSRQREQASLSHGLYIGCQQRAWRGLKVDLLISEDLD